MLQLIKRSAVAKITIMALSKILPLEQAMARVQELKRQGRRVVFTNGCFDLLHPGHTRYLGAARKLGDVLVVELNSDRTVRALKGTYRTIIPESVRDDVFSAFLSVVAVNIIV